jgi:hypothetical protein
LNAIAKTMTVNCTISQTGYVPQSGLLSCYQEAVAAADWTLPPSYRDPSVATALGRVPDSLFNPTVSVFEKEDQVRSGAYQLYLDARSAAPRWIYSDQHIYIQFVFDFNPYTSGNGIDGTTCRPTWSLLVQKKRRSGGVGYLFLKDVKQLSIGQSTYGVDNTGPKAAAVARYLQFDYSAASAQVNNISYPSTFRSSIGASSWVVNFTTDGTLPLANETVTLYEPGYVGVTETASGNLDSRLTIDLGKQYRANSAYALYDRTGSEVEPLLVQNPTYSVDRPDPSYIRFRQDAATVSDKTIGYVGTQFSVSALVQMDR